MPIGGVLTAMVTPFDADGRVDEAAAVELMHFLLANGSDGVVVAGTTGEGATLDDEEKCRLFELAVAECGDALVIAGTGSNDTAHTVHLTERATEIGVHAHLVVTPYYNKPNPRGIVAHFSAVAEATDRPIIAYNIPSRCVVDVPNDLLRELAQTIPEVQAVKQANNDNLEAIDGLDLLAGNDDVLARTMDLGGTGGILVASHLFGNEMKRIVEEPDARQELHASLEDAFRALSVTTNPMPIKAALRMAGHQVGGFRLPMVDLSEEEEAEVRAMLERYGLLSTV
ncbi:MAG TPA: 4-hydroxy-tetrahydrodipicolinate synthase [Thermoleophilaceae bacterium]|jgi:4-hydroxy-tetrahydrodipicolinate synthase